MTGLATGENKESLTNAESVLTLLQSMPIGKGKGKRGKKGSSFHFSYLHLD